MTLDKARQLLQVQVDFGGGYNRNSAKLILAEVVREHGQAEANRMINDMHLDEVFGFAPVTVQHHI